MKFNKDQTVAVDPDVFWRSMDTCPRAVKVQLLSGGGVAMYALYDGQNKFWQGWSPVPKRRPVASLPASA